jgi:hypothetical protein
MNGRRPKMSPPRFILATCLALLFASAPALGEAYVELDFDGIVGNGPEYNHCIDFGSYHLVDVWLLGDIPIRGFRISICNPSGCLDLLQSQYSVPAGWTTHPVIEGECIVLQAEEPIVTGVPGGSAVSPESWGSVKSKFREHGDSPSKCETNALQLPVRVATLVYHVVEEHCVAPLTIEEAIYVDADNAAGTFQGNNGCYFFIVVCKAAPSSYGSVKTLFR